MGFRVSTRDWFLNLWRTLVPRSYSAPLETENDGSGLDLTAQSAAIFARNSEASSVTTQAYYIRPHSTQDNPPGAGAEKAIGIVEVSRIAPAIGAITVPAGTLVVATVRHPDGSTSEGERFQTVSDVTLPSGDLGPYSIDIEALRVGYQGNLNAGSIDHFGLRGSASVPNATANGNTITDSGVADVFTQSMVGAYLRITSGVNANTVPRRILSFTTGSVVVDGPALTLSICNIEVEEWSELGLLVSQPINTFNGRHGWLDASGQDRNVYRVAGEGDEPYRERIEALADIISPGAIGRIAARILTPLGIPYEIVEAGDGLPGLVYEFSPYDADELGSWYMPAVRFFIVKVGNSSLGEFGFAYDATSMVNAYDNVTQTPPNQNFYDGSPVQYLTAIQSLWQSLNQARAAGVGFAIVKVDSL